MTRAPLSRTVLSLLAAAAVAATTLTVHAEERDRDRGPERGPERGVVRAPQRGYVFDHRFEHDRYYPQRGFAVSVLPRGYYSVPYRGAPYFFAGGVWYRNYGPRYVVVEPPLGIGIPVLPAGYTTVWINGTPYYYADGTYYLWHGDQQAYVVTSPPPNADSGSTATPTDEEVFAYPKNGQSEAQQASDRYTCHDWARGQSGFDPTQPLGGVDAQQAAAKRSDYLRAQKACLEARGYTVH